MRQRWWIIAALGLVAPTALSACDVALDVPTACYQLIGVAGERLMVLNGCTGNVELRDPPPFEPPATSTTTLPRTEV